MFVARTRYLMVMSMRFGSSSEGWASASTSWMRGSHLDSDSTQYSAATVEVASVLGEKSRSWMWQPNAGRITRSPGAVPRMIRSD